MLHVHLGLYGAWDFGGDATFRGASSIGAPRKVGEREVYDDADGEPVPACVRGPARARRRRPRPARRRARLGGPARRHHVRGDHRGGSGGRPGPARPGPAAEPARATGTPSSPGVPARRTPLAALLMDQKVIAGVGNVYRAELLFRQRLDPWLPGNALSAGRGRAGCGTTPRR